VETYRIDYCAYPAPAVVGIEDQPKEKGQSLKWVHTWYYHGDQWERLEKHFDVVGRDMFGMTENGICLYVPVDRPDLAAAGSVGVVAPWREVRIAA
jgi:long-chain acyl-CoA synthetase/crotonobetaine/carnitine-CoA ligase